LPLPTLTTVEGLALSQEGNPQTHSTGYNISLTGLFDCQLDYQVPVYILQLKCMLVCCRHPLPA